MADLLDWFGTRRKSPAVAATIELALEEKGLTARPPIMEAGYSDEIELVPVVDDTAPADDDSVEPMWPRLIKLHVGRLRAATDGVVSVFPHDHLVKAQTLMLSHNFSQLAVIEKSGEFCGAVSWESIGKAHLAERAVQLLVQAGVHRDRRHRPDDGAHHSDQRQGGDDEPRAQRARLP